MFRLQLLIVVLCLAGCAKRDERRKLPPRPFSAPIEPLPPAVEPVKPIISKPEPSWRPIDRGPNPDRVICYLNATETQVKTHCINGVCYYRIDRHRPSELIRYELGRLTDPNWKVGTNAGKHFQIVDMTFDGVVRLADCPVVVKYRDGREVARLNNALVDGVWLTKFYHEPKSRAVASSDAAAAQTPMEEVDRVLRLLPTPTIGFVDWGCGDGRWCIAAARRWGCRATGVEIDPARAEAARERVRSEGLSHLVTIVTGDATQVHVEADVGVAYLYGDVLQAMIPRIHSLRAFASYLHQPPGLPVTKDGDTWFYRQGVVQQQRTATWGGYSYSGRVCNDPRCKMCASIQFQLQQSW